MSDGVVILDMSIAEQEDYVIAIGLVFTLVSLGLVLVIYGTIAKNRWGVNLDPVRCPRCNMPLSQVRTPNSVHQAMWGGCTCPKCGIEVDKWGREVSNIARSS